jgi:RNA polymerase sigma-70 factor (ECF subfamily)
VTADIGARRVSNEASDAALWLEATSGTESSFAVLFNRHRVRVFRKAYSRVQNVSDAEDIVAVVFLEAWRNRAKVRIVEGSLLPWLLSVTTYVTLNSARSSRRYRHLIDTLPAPEKQDDDTVVIDDAIDRQRVNAAIWEALTKLNSSDQLILDLCIVEELPLASAAAVLNVPVGTVKSRLHRARAKLRRNLVESADFDTQIALVVATDGAGL